VRVLENRKDFTLDSLIAAAYDSYLTWFDKPLPALIKSWDALPASNPLKDKLSGQIAVLRKWDQRWGVDSVATTLAVFWGDELAKHPDQSLEALAAASGQLTADFGSWRIPWGEINRFQRLTGEIVQPFNDAGPSIPVGFTYSKWGSLASFAAKPYPGTKKWYGASGNSFVAVVEFGDRVHAKAVTAGGESGHPTSRHFNDEAVRYSQGNLREVYFYPDQLEGHTERKYHP